MPGARARAAGLFLLLTYQKLISSNLVEVPAVLWIVLCILTAIQAFSVVGFLRVTLEPFVWAVLLASLSTVNRALELSEDGLNLIGLAWSVAL